MPTNESTIEILIADDSLLRELGMKQNDVEIFLSLALKSISTDLNRQVRVRFLSNQLELHKAINEKQWDFIALDNKWEKPDNAEFGFQLAKELRAKEGPNQDAPICIFSNQEWLEQPENLNKLYKLDERLADVGSFADFFPKPKPPLENSDGNPWLRFFATELLVRMKACFLLRSFRQKLIALDKVLATEMGMVGVSPAIQEIIEACRIVAPRTIPVLITGESGTGKENVARTIHRFSHRSNSPFIPINCPSLPENFIETELFGYGRLSGIAGADPKGKAGKFELADKGVLFLDEIGDMPLSAQAKVLRFLQDGQFERIGSNEPVTVDVQIIAATNKPLEELIRTKQFREDLYERLNVIRIQMPPLSKRREDIPTLVEHFIQKHGHELSNHIHRVAPDAMALLEKQSWPRNIRQLENTIRSALVYAKDTQIELSADDIHRAINRLSETASNSIGEGCSRAKDEGIKQYLERRKKEEIQKALEEGGNQKIAAALLGLPAPTLNDWMERVGLRAK